MVVISSNENGFSSKLPEGPNLKLPDGPAAPKWWALQEELKFNSLVWSIDTNDGPPGRNVGVGAPGILRLLSGLPSEVRDRLVWMYAIFLEHLGSEAKCPTMLQLQHLAGTGTSVRLSSFPSSVFMARSSLFSVSGHFIVSWLPAQRQHRSCMQQFRAPWSLQEILIVKFYRSRRYFWDFMYVETIPMFIQTNSEYELSEIPIRHRYNLTILKYWSTWYTVNVNYYSLLV